MKWMVGLLPLMTLPTPMAVLKSPRPLEESNLWKREEGR